MSDQQPYLATGVLASMYKDIPGAGMGGTGTPSAMREHLFRLDPNRGQPVGRWSLIWMCRTFLSYPLRHASASVLIAQVAPAALRTSAPAWRPF
uniref:Uncharacterized protein n=1 Tax=Rhodococcus hoagii TaxID=43767 RepID=A0A1Z1UVR7_RHOHA|nr:hypothetical protein pVAPB1475_0441 [Prescottella equi]